MIEITLVILLVAFTFYVLTLIFNRVKRKSRKYIYSLGLCTFIGILVNNLLG